jgi:hypothetical protein
MSTTNPESESKPVLLPRLSMAKINRPYDLSPGCRKYLKHLDGWLKTSTRAAEVEERFKAERPLLDEMNVYRDGYYLVVRCFADSCYLARTQMSADWYKSSVTFVWSI